LASKNGIKDLHIMIFYLETGSDFNGNVPARSPATKTNIIKSLIVLSFLKNYHLMMVINLAKHVVVLLK
jgi:hypothetical protein